MFESVRTVDESAPVSAYDKVDCVTLFHVKIWCKLLIPFGFIFSGVDTAHTLHC